MKYIILFSLMSVCFADGSYQTAAERQAASMMKKEKRMAAKRAAEGAREAAKMARKEKMMRKKARARR